MGKKIKYNFKLKLKILKFFNLHRVMPPPPTFPQKWIIGGARLREIQYILNKYIVKIFIKYFLK